VAKVVLRADAIYWMIGLRVLELLDDWFGSTRIPELARNEKVK
jgi:hypothetical protein